MRPASRCNRRPVAPRALASLRCSLRVLPFLLALLGAVPRSAAVVIDWVQVGNPGNAPDTAAPACYSTPGSCGSVSYTYYISKYDTTNAQYAEFLNAVDAEGSDAHLLYDTAMGTDSSNGGIGFVDGNPSGSKYVVNSGFADKPVVRVSFYSALRFANWLDNGQGSGSTETGAYTITGPGIAVNSILRNVGANVVDGIVRARTESGAYTSFPDFLDKVDIVVCNKRVLESLAKAGAFDSLGHTRKGLVAIHADAAEGVQIDPKRLGALFKAAADAGYIRLVGAENAAREESKGHLIRTWKRTRKELPAHVCEVSAA